MNANFTQFVYRLSKFDETSLQERKLLEGVAQDKYSRAEAAAHQIEWEAEEKNQTLQAGLKRSEAQIRELRSRIPQTERDFQEMEALSINCPVEALQALYKQKAEGLKDLIGKRKAEAAGAEIEAEMQKEETIALIRAGMEMAKRNADQTLKEAKLDPAVELWNAVAATIRREIMHLIDVGRYPEAERATQMEGDKGLLREIREQINAKRIAVSAAKKTLHEPQMLDLPKEAWALGLKAEVVIAIDRGRNECARWAVSPLGHVYPLEPSKRKWTSDGGVHFSRIADLAKRESRNLTMAARAA